MIAPLAGKVAIVTGAGRMRGIGRAIALRLAEDGADVVVSAIARSPEAMPQREGEAGWRGAQSVADEIEAMGRHTLALDADITNPSAVQEVVKRAISELGRIDTSVNNAGLALVSGKKNLWEMEDDARQPPRPSSSRAKAAASSTFPRSRAASPSRSTAATRPPSSRSSGSPRCSPSNWRRITLP